MGMGGGGSQTTTQKSEPWEAQKPYLTDIYGQAQQLYQQGQPAYYPGSTVVPYSDATNQAFGMLQDRATNAVPGQLTQGLDMATAIGSGALLGQNPGYQAAGGVQNQIMGLNSMLAPLAAGGVGNNNPAYGVLGSAAQQAQLASMFGPGGTGLANPLTGQAASYLNNLAQAPGQGFQVDPNNPAFGLLRDIATGSGLSGSMDMSGFQNAMSMVQGMPGSLSSKIGGLMGQIGSVNLGNNEGLQFLKSIFDKPATDNPAYQAINQVLGGDLTSNPAFGYLQGIAQNGADLTTARSPLEQMIAEDPMASPAYQYLNPLARGDFVGTGAANQGLARLASGEMIGSNPYLDATFDRGAQAISRNFNQNIKPGFESYMAGQGRYGSASMMQALGEKLRENVSDPVANYANQLYGADYQQGMDRMLAGGQALGTLTATERDLQTRAALGLVTPYEQAQQRRMQAATGLAGIGIEGGRLQTDAAKTLGDIYEGGAERKFKAATTLSDIYRQQLEAGTGAAQTYADTLARGELAKISTQASIASSIASAEVDAYRAQIGAMADVARAQAGAAASMASARAGAQASAAGQLGQLYLGQQQLSLDALQGQQGTQLQAASLLGNLGLGTGGQSIDAYTAMLGGLGQQVNAGSALGNIFSQQSGQNLQAMLGAYGQMGQNLQTGAGLASTIGGLYGQDQQAMLQGLSQIPGMAELQSNMGLQGIQGLLSVGGAQEDLAARQLQDEIARYQYGANAPAANLSQYLQFIQGATPQAMQVQTTQPTNSNPLMSILGLGMAGAGIAGGMFGPGWARGLF